MIEDDIQNAIDGEPLSDETLIRLSNMRREMLQSFNPRTSVSKFINQTALLFHEIERLRMMVEKKGSVASRLQKLEEFNDLTRGEMAGFENRISNIEDFLEQMNESQHQLWVAMEDSGNQLIKMQTENKTLKQHLNPEPTKAKFTDTVVTPAFYHPSEDWEDVKEALYILGVSRNCSKWAAQCDHSEFDTAREAARYQVRSMAMRTQKLGDELLNAVAIEPAGPAPWGDIAPEASEAELKAMVANEAQKPKGI